jgi:hypothetical protein
MSEKIKAWWRGEHIKPSSHVDFFGQVFMTILWSICVGIWITLWGVTGNFVFALDFVAYGAVVFLRLRGLRFRMLAVNEFYYKELDFQRKSLEQKARSEMSLASLDHNQQFAEIQSKDATIRGLQRELESRPPASTV